MIHNSPEKRSERRGQGRRAEKKKEKWIHSKVEWREVGWRGGEWVVRSGEERRAAKNEKSGEESGR